jgi:hypothetical protein
MSAMSLPSPPLKKIVAGAADETVRTEPAEELPRSCRPAASPLASMMFHCRRGHRSPSWSPRSPAFGVNDVDRRRQASLTSTPSASPDIADPGRQRQCRSTVSRSPPDRRQPWLLRESMLILAHVMVP